MSLTRKAIHACLALALVHTITSSAQPAARPTVAPQPWMNTSLDADTRADLLIHEMTLDEKILLVHGAPNHDGPNATPGFNGGAGIIPGIARLGLPPINMADSAVGITKGASRSRYSTLLPSTLGMSASWDPDTAFLYGSIIGRELRQQGYNMSIGGGVDLIREPRNGRNFEYSSEDPILSGIMIGQLGRGIQSAHIMGDIKHYVMNDQETGRDTYNALIDNRTMRETDLLAFQIAIGLAKPAGVMCAYNRINGDYSCENDYTLNQVLKRDWKFQGFVLSDWGGTHSTVKAALAGLDQDMPGSDKYFSDPLKQAVISGAVPQARLDDMVHRIVRSMFANDIIDHPTNREEVVDPFRGRDEAQKIEEKSLVLLQNTGNILPLSSAKINSIAIIGGHADVGILSGGGSAQVNPPGGNAVEYTSGNDQRRRVNYFPSSPMRSMQELAPDTNITYDPGTDNAQAAKTAASAKLAIVFVTQPMEEGSDRPTLSLPDDQDALVSAVAAANPNTIVILETGGPVSMPWAPKVKAILESWFPGIGGGQAIANVLFGRVNPSAKLPVTFAASDRDLPHPHVSGLTERTTNNGLDAKGGAHNERDFPVDYNVEGMAVGYRWFQQKNIKPLFPFGFGLSYTHFAYSKLNASATTVSFDLHNSGSIAGDEIAEVYVTLPTSTGEPFRKLAGWKRVTLAPGATQRVEVPIDPLYLSTFSTDTNKWSQPAGDFLIEAGGSSNDLPLHQSLHLTAQ
ncbi:MAG TPA: glycoside hydrolase family 3 C-terminal domain-containing protein [Acidobacteriaceae bacterium]|nr:glycoside hydrolase family 3 C-terminal domain-containing protein [Acidobacteriaceae bacterium]